MTSYPTIFRKYTSSDPISLKIGTIVHFDDTRSQKKNSERFRHFNVVMTSSFFGDDVISDDFDDVITASKMSESIWIFFLWPCIVKLNNRANFYENLFGGSVFSEKRRIWRHFLTSYPMIFRKYTSSDPISLKNGTIAHFDDSMY